MPGSLSNSRKDSMHSKTWLRARCLESRTSDRVPALSSASRRSSLHRIISTSESFIRDGSGTLGIPYLMDVIFPPKPRSRARDERVRSLRVVPSAGGHFKVAGAYFGARPKPHRSRLRRAVRDEPRRGAPQRGPLPSCARARCGARTAPMMSRASKNRAGSAYHQQRGDQLAAAAGCRRSIARRDGDA